MPSQPSTMVRARPEQRRSDRPERFFHYHGNDNFQLKSINSIQMLHGIYSFHIRTNPQHDPQTWKPKPPRQIRPQRVRNACRHCASRWVFPNGTRSPRRVDPYDSRGDRKGRIDPSLGTLKRLLEACGVSMSEFFRNENNASIVTEAHRINTVSTGGVHMRYLAPSAPGKLLQITQEIYDAGADTGTKPLRHEGQEGVSSSAAFSNCSWETSGIRSGPATATTSTARRRTGCATSGKSRARSSMRPRHPPSSVVIAPESCGRDA